MHLAFLVWCLETFSGWNRGTHHSFTRRVLCRSCLALEWISWLRQQTVTLVVSGRRERNPINTEKSLIKGAVAAIVYSGIWGAYTTSFTRVFEKEKLEWDLDRAGLVTSTIECVCSSHSNNNTHTKHTKSPWHGRTTDEEEVTQNEFVRACVCVCVSNGLFLGEISIFIVLSHACCCSSVEEAASARAVTHLSILLAQGLMVTHVHNFPQAQK